MTTIATDVVAIEVATILRATADSLRDSARAQMTLHTYLLQLAHELRPDEDVPEDVPRIGGNGHWSVKA
jgi:hypothetical protein